MICSRDSFAFFPLRSLVIHFVHTVCSLFEPLCVCVLCPHCANIEKEKLRDLCFRFCFILFLFLSLHSFIRSLVRSVAACISKLICIQFHCNWQAVRIPHVCNRYANSRTTHQTVKLLSIWNIDFKSRIQVLWWNKPPFLSNTAVEWRFWQIDKLMELP